MEGNKANKTGKILLIVVLCLCIPAILTAVVYGILTFLNRYAIDMAMHGPELITLEYGEAYVEYGAEATFRGTVFHKDGIPLEVRIDNSVDVQRVGRYEINYTANRDDISEKLTRFVEVVDRTAPRLLLKGSPVAYVIPGSDYEEEGVMAFDEYEGDLTEHIIISKEEDRICYSVTDSSGNEATVVRKLLYHDPLPPEIVLAGDRKITITAGSKFKDPGYSAMDNVDGNLTDAVIVTGDVNIYRAGTYTITYSVKDSFENESTVVREVRVKAKSQPATKTPSGKVVYLTFDDGPSEFTPRLLDLLDQYGVKATFFVMNTGYVDTIRRIAEDGHALAVHTATHNYKSIYASEEAYFKDLKKMASIIEEIAGVKTTLIRFPGGSSNTVSRFNKGIMTRLTKSVRDLGYQYFDWNVDSNDAGGAKSAEEVAENVINGIKKYKTSIVLQHDTKSFSIDAVERIIQWGLENGYKFLPLDETSPGMHHGLNN